MNQEASSKGTVLVAEDDALLLVTLQNQLEDAGYRVVTAKNGIEGTALYETESPDAVILDVMMPEKDGVTMLEELRAKHPDDKTPFIVLSNANDMDYVARAMAQGAVAYLLKSDRQIDSVVRLVEEKIKKA